MTKLVEEVTQKIYTALVAKHLETDYVSGKMFAEFYQQAYKSALLFQISHLEQIGSEKGED